MTFGLRAAVMAFALSACLPAGATSIVILRSAKRVYIGADSRRMYRDPAATFNGTVCKIAAAGEYLFVASGLTYANDEQVSDIGVEAGRDAHSMKAAAQLVSRRMQQFLPQALAAEKQIEHASAERPSLVLETAFAGVERGTPQVMVAWYRRTGDGRVSVESHTYSSALPGRYDFIFLGKRRAIDDRLKGQYPAIRSDQDAAAFISQMIELEISESPETTAGPIDIVKVDGSGSRWIQEKPACDVDAR